MRNGRSFKCWRLRQRLITALSVMAAASSIRCTAQPAFKSTPPDNSRHTARPNIIVIMADDHAAPAISAYGSRINATPHIDRLARVGMRFTNCFCTNSLCSPSRATTLTGTYSHVNTVIDLSVSLPVSAVTFPELLRRSGYETALIGKWHLHRDPTGFDHWDILPEQGEYIDPEFIANGVRTKYQGHVTQLITRKSLDWLASRRGDKPFLLLCWHKAPHRPWQPDPEHAHRFANVDISLPETFDDDYATRSDAARRATMTIASDLTPEDLKQPIPPGLSGAALKTWKFERFMRDYLACVAGVDDGVGALLDWLDASSFAANTIVVYTSDQGFFLGDHGWYDKRFMYEEALRMPLLVRYPGHIAPGAVCDRLALNLDFAPTLLDYAGVAVPAAMQGRSLRPLLSGQSPANWRSSLYYHYYDDGPPHHVAAHYGVRTNRYKLMRFYGKVVAWELYDLRADPHELHNVYADPQYAPVRDELIAELSRQRTQYGDQDEAVKK